MKPINTIALQLMQQGLYGKDFRVVNQAERSQMYLYDVIGSMGVSAKRFVEELGTAGGRPVDLHLNSLGGEAFDGLAIHNAIRNYAPGVDVYIDGVAASAGSLIAIAGQRVFIEDNAQMMTHDALCLTFGNEADHERAIGALRQMSDTLAGIYATRSGRNTEHWRELMRAETWFSAQEAVAAGLADEVRGTQAAQPVNRWDLSIFNYAGREAAPAPTITNEPADPLDEIFRVFQEVPK
jgi:ATP-dependent protease ClpP protease subunit